MPIKFSGPVKPQKLKSPDPINMPAVRSDRAPKIKSEVEYFKEHGMMPLAKIRTAIDYRDATGEMGTEKALSFANTVGSPAIAYESDFNGVRMTSLNAWRAADLYDNEKGEFFTFAIYPDDDFELSFRFGQIAYSSNRSTFMLFRDTVRDAADSNSKALLVWSVDVGASVSTYTQFRINSVSMLGRHSAVAGTDYDYLSVDSFKLVKQGSDVSLYAKDVLVDTAPWPYVDVYRPTMRIQNYSAGANLKDLVFKYI